MADPIRLAGAGLAPVSKTSESLAAETAHLSQPVAACPGGAADGVEDVVALSAMPAQALRGIAGRIDRLAAIDLITATQAIALCNLDPVPDWIRTQTAKLRGIVLPVTPDRSLTGDIEKLANEVPSGLFAAHPSWDAAPIYWRLRHFPDIL